MHPLESWLKSKGWTPWPFQREAWQAFAAGREGLIHVATGAGKTYAAFGGPLAALATNEPAKQGLKVIYVTPLKALARDIEAALALPLAELGLPFRVESRTGDTSNATRSRQRKQLPEVLITTPESLALMLARSDAKDSLSGVVAMIVDEWHELLTSKRGTLLQLTLARVRALSPSAKTWGISATLADPEAAARALLPCGVEPVVVRGEMPRAVIVDTLLPESVNTFPWAGHLGLSMLPALLADIDVSVSNLIFTNTRSQAERWYQAILQARPQWQKYLALHHGSLSREDREMVESGLKDGTTRVVVATSSLDLGVDFPAVERVFQIGSPKALGRFVQRAGRGAHRPMASCRMTCVPANELEIFEYAAARRGLERGELELRISARGSLDVLIQHLCTVALGGGFLADEMFSEIESTAAFSGVSRADFDWALAFITTGGSVLNAYPAYRRVAKENDRYVMTDRRQSSVHRMNIGTIVADEQAQIKMRRGKTLGRIDEAFVARLKPGDTFMFAGRTLELEKLYDLVAYVKLASKKIALAPSWQGTLLPLSPPLGRGMRALLAEIEEGGTFSAAEPELVAIMPLIEAQRVRSRVPKNSQLLFEVWEHRDGSYLFVYPFAGRVVHEAMAALLALRLSRRIKTTFSTTANDYGFAIISTVPVDFHSVVSTADFSEQQLVEDLDQTVDAAQMAKRHFREIARISGMVPQSYPGKRKSGMAVHASASLLYATLDRFDPGHLLVELAKVEARDALGGEGQLVDTLRRARSVEWIWAPLRRPSPFAFPLVVERVRARLGSESLAERIERMTASWIKEESRGKRGGDHGRRTTNARRTRGAAPTGASSAVGHPEDPDRSGPPLGQE